MHRSASTDTDYDVAVVGGGPAGCSAGVFTARYGLATAIFDRGRSSIRRCAYLENYLGFPAGIDIDTYYELMHEHVEEAGCELVADLVESVERIGDAGGAEGDDGDDQIGTDAGGFGLETQEGRAVTARYVVAAAKYAADYLRALDREEAMFETHDHGGEEHEHFDREYPDDDGRTPIEGLYVAGPLAGVGDQAIIAAGHGAQVARILIEDERRALGYWDGVAEHYDWIRREEELTDEWRDRDRWREWIDGNVPDDVALSDEEYERIREGEIDARLATYVERQEVERRTERGHRRLAERLDDELLLDVLDDERVREYAAALDADAE